MPKTLQRNFDRLLSRARHGEVLDFTGIDFGGIKVIPLAEFLAHNSELRLTTLVMSRCSLDAQYLGHLGKGILRHQNLRAIDLSYNQITNDGGSRIKIFFRYLEDAKHIENLNLTGNYIPPSTVIAGAKLTSARPKLRIIGLDLSDPSIHGTDIQR